jgi:predicted chitinase
VRTAEQIRQACVPIGWPEVRPGDLLFFAGTYNAAGPAGPDGRIASHIGISLGAGSGKMWDAHGAGVQLTDVRTDYWQTAMFEARRHPALAVAEAAQSYGIPSAGAAFAPGPLTVDEIHHATSCPRSAIAQYWPAIYAALEERGAASRASCAGAVATIAIETASTFAPIDEYGGEAYFTRQYEGRADLGNTQPGDGARYHGRGFIQLTGRANYRTYGERYGADLVGQPDLALDAAIASQVFADYWVARGIPAACERGDWPQVRKSVQGGSNGLDRLIAMVQRLGY